MNISQSPRINLSAEWLWITCSCNGYSTLPTLAMATAHYQHLQWPQHITNSCNGYSTMQRSIHKKKALLHELENGFYDQV